ncbi:hypothetical protein BD626DRAFT_568486 [Schizophyllum amplum]|uniref:Uncharacterized protein n=1 Tax=Schizophyllum amplum TaxID=97359 RepID=A0A550CGF2_9AGAR|nr:hypothetical protein BD626DRAFT_568486 [Auriculariopsis ampla]
MPATVRTMGDAEADLVEGAPDESGIPDERDKPEEALVTPPSRASGELRLSTGDPFLGTGEVDRVMPGGVLPTSWVANCPLSTEVILLIAVVASCPLSRGAIHPVGAAASPTPPWRPAMPTRCSAILSASQATLFAPLATLSLSPDDGAPAKGFLAAVKLVYWAVESGPGDRTIGARELNVGTPRLVTPPALDPEPETRVCTLSADCACVASVYGYESSCAGRAYAYVGSGLYTAGAF